MNMPIRMISPNVHLPYHSAPIVPSVNPVAAPRMSVVFNWRMTACCQRVICTWPPDSPRTMMVADCRPVFPLMAEMIGMKLASSKTCASVAS